MNKQLLQVSLEEAQKAEADLQEQLDSTRQQLDSTRERLHASTKRTRELEEKVLKLTSVVVYNVDTGEEEVQHRSVARVLDDRKRHREVVPQKAAEARQEASVRNSN